MNSNLRRRLLRAAHAPGKAVGTPVRRWQRPCGARAATGERHPGGAGAGAGHGPGAAAEEARRTQARRRLHAQERRLKPPRKGVASPFLCRRGGDGTGPRSYRRRRRQQSPRRPPGSAPRSCPALTCGPRPPAPGPSPALGGLRGSGGSAAGAAGRECLSCRRVRLGVPVASPLVPRRPGRLPRCHEHQRRLPPAHQHLGPHGAGRVGHRPALRDELPCRGRRRRRRRHPHPQDLLLPEDLRRGLRLRRIRVGAGPAGPRSLGAAVGAAVSPLAVRSPGCASLRDSFSCSSLRRLNF